MDTEWFEFILKQRFTMLPNFTLFVDVETSWCHTKKVPLQQDCV
jgi:hypothetical protein